MKAERLTVTADQLNVGDRIVEWQGAKWTPSTVVTLSIREGRGYVVGTQWKRDPATVRVATRTGNRGGIRSLTATDVLVVERTPIQL